MPYFLGVDTGGTKSVAMVTDENGRVMGTGRAGAGNWEMIGWDKTRQVITKIVSEALDEAGLKPAQISSAGFGLAGYDWPEDYQPHADIIAGLLPDIPSKLVNDAFVGLWAGSESGWGVVVSAGTSCNCYGRDQQGHVGRVTGSSYLSGERAGAGEIVKFAVQSVAEAWSKRGPETALAKAFCLETGAADVSDLLAGLMRGRYQIDASLAPIVFKTAEQNDEVAQNIIHWAGEGLADLILGVARQINIQEKRFDVVLSGTVLMDNHILQKTLAETVKRQAPLAAFICLSSPPVTGAILMAMDHIGQATTAARKNLVSLAKILL